MGKNNKKGIGLGIKIFSALAVLIVAFFIYNMLSNIGMEQARSSIQDLSDSYMKMQEHNEALSKNVAEARLYSNLIVMLPDEASAMAMAGEVQKFIDEIDGGKAEE